MLERIDIMFGAALERMIQGVIYGDKEKEGLLRRFQNCQTMEQVERTKGIIEGFEAVLVMMEQLRKEFNEPDRPQAPRPQQHWPRTN